MNQFSSMVRKYSAACNHKLKRFCAPIEKHFGVSHICYYSVTNDGRYNCLGSNLEWTEYYFAEKLYIANPYLRTPDNFTSGSSFIRHIKDEDFQQSVDIGVDNFNVNQSLVLLEKTKEGMTGICFASSDPGNAFEILSMNEMPLLKAFTKAFAENFSSEIKKIENDSVDLTSAIGPSFFHKEKSLLVPAVNKNAFLDCLGLSDFLELSSREREVLQHISKGWAAIQIAEHLVLSKRTVEHYSESIRNKLNCESKTELIQKAQALLAAGYSLS